MPDIHTIIRPKDRSRHTGADGSIEAAPKDWRLVRFEGAILSAIGNAEQNGVGQKRLIARGRQISEQLPTLPADTVRSALMTLVDRVDIKAEHIEIRLYRQRLHDLLRPQSIDALGPPQRSRIGPTIF